MFRNISNFCGFILLIFVQHDLIVIKRDYHVHCQKCHFQAGYVNYQQTFSSTKKRTNIVYENFCKLKIIKKSIMIIFTSLNLTKYFLHYQISNHGDRKNFIIYFIGLRLELTTIIYNMGTWVIHCDIFLSLPRSLWQLLSHLKDIALSIIQLIITRLVWK